MTDTFVRDQLAIRSLIENYSDAVMRRDLPAVMALWTEDCHWGVPDMPGLESLSGKAAIQQALGGAQAVLPFVFLLCIPGNIAIEEGHATARSYTTEITTDLDGNTKKAVGRYDDQFVKRGDQWFFSERIWHLMHAD